MATYEAKDFSKVIILLSSNLAPIAKWNNSSYEYFFNIFSKLPKDKIFIVINNYISKFIIILCSFFTNLVKYSFLMKLNLFNKFSMLLLHRRIDFPTEQCTRLLETILFFFSN